MNAYRVKISVSAQEDIYKIVQYIRMVLQEPRTADKLYFKLKEEIYSLTALPERCPVLQLPALQGIEVRRLTVKNYSVLYQVDKTGGVVTVGRVMYSGRDIARQLEDTNWDEA